MFTGKYLLTMIPPTVARRNTTSCSIRRQSHRPLWADGRATRDGVAAYRQRPIRYSASDAVVHSGRERRTRHRPVTRHGVGSPNRSRERLTAQNAHFRTRQAA